MHPHRSSAMRYALAASAAHSRVYAECAAEAAVSEASGPSCTRASAVLLGYHTPCEHDSGFRGGGL